MQARRPRFEADPERRQEALGRFAGAATTGDVRALAEALAEDVVVLSDGGGIAEAARRPVSGRDTVARFLEALLPHYSAPDYRWESGLVNARPGLLIWRGETLDTVMSFEVADGLVSGIHVQPNPEKLSAVGWRTKPVRSNITRLTTTELSATTSSTQECWPRCSRGSRRCSTLSGAERHWTRAPHHGRLDPFDNRLYCQWWR